MLELELTNNQETENKPQDAEIKPLTAEMSAEEPQNFAPEIKPQTESESANTEETEFLKNYEVKSWAFTPYLYKVLAASVVVNLLFIAIVAQGDLLRTRACDSPFVGKVCQVLDTVYIGSVLLGTDTEYSNYDYEKTMIEDSDDVIFNNLSGTDPVVYPAGYFALANPEQYQVIDEMNPSAGFPGSTFPYVAPPAAGFPNSTVNPTITNPTTPNPIAPNPIAPPIKRGGGVLGKQPKYPKPRKNPIANLPDSIDDNATADNGKKTGDDKDKTKPEDDKAVAQDSNKVKSDPVEEKEGFNKQPIEDFGNKYSDLILKKEIDINAPFEVEVTTKLDENGKFIKPVMTAKEGSDPKMTNLAKEAIAVFSDSKLLKPLYDVGGRDLKIKFAQDKDNLQVIIFTQTASDTRAKTLSSLLGAYLKAKPPKEGSDEAELFGKIQQSTQDKNFIINFVIPNDEKSAMIFKNLQKLQEKAKNQSNKSAEDENKKQVAAGK